ncbi:MAG: hypothetical protein QM741_02060 [Rudaea sp.]|uniref:type IV pilus modification PilV family protein n=1 Tax=Rudaea sp. TaxID=2136325 RepID=UPI0039E36936
MNVPRSTARQHGMMLIEVMIAILVFAIGVLGMVKMKAVAIANSVNAEDRATAALLANDLITEMWVAKSSATPSDYTTWQSRVSDALPGGSGALNVTGTVATVTITWPRKLGRNVESGPTDTTATDAINIATYMTQVVIQ